MINKEGHSHNITSLVLIFPVIVLLIYSALIYMYLAYDQSRTIKWGMVQYKTHMIEIEVNYLKEKTYNLAQFIRYYDSKSSAKIKKDVKQIVYSAANVAQSLYNSYEDKSDKSKIRNMIIKALENIHIEGKSGYLFMLDMEGNILMHGDKSIIGKNFMDVSDSNGKEFVKEFTAIASSKNGEGYCSYYWYIPNLKEPKMVPKISFIKKIKGLDCYIGEGEYISYMRKYLRGDMLKYIESNGNFEDGYLFVTNSLGETIYHPSGDASQDASKYLIEGVYRDDTRLAYTEYIAQYDWYITAVKYLGNINKNIENNKAHLYSTQEKNISVSLWILAMILILSLLLSLFLSGIINRMLNEYEEQLKVSSEQLMFQSRQALIGELLPMIAHQWRQPINKIASTIALIRFGIKEDKCDINDIDQQCLKIEESMEFMSETIDDFRTFYKPKTENELAELDTLVSKAIEFVEGAIKNKNIQLSTRLSKIDYRLYTNEYLQVMINLIKNATDASSQDGQIDIRLYENDEVIYTEVTDNGVGIAQENISKVFEPYFTTKDNSMGLGLYMSKMIIEKHMGGTIQATNLPDGRTRFTVKFYRQEEE